MTDKAQTCDVLVIGGGIAGLVAANRAAELGKKVIVLEQGGDPKYLCNTRYTGGTFHVCSQDINLGPEHLLNTIRADTGGFARDDLSHAMADNSLRLMRWLQAEGIRFIKLTGHQTFVLAPPSRTGPGLDWDGRGGDVFLRTMEANLNKRGGAILRGMRARALDRSNGGHIDVKVDVTEPTATRRFRAGAVVIADGGFQGDASLVRENISRFPEKILQRGAGTGVGDGLRMAQSAGAAIVSLDCFYGHLLSRDALHNNRLWPRPYLDAVVTAGIIVNAEGARFADEGCGGVDLANAVARLPDPLSTTVVFDHAIWEGPGRTNLVASNPHLPDAGGTLHKAGSIAELAALAGLPAHQLEATVKTYNVALESGRLADLAPSRRGDKFKPFPIKVAPFYAVPVCTGITYTMGGIAINDHAAVLDTNGRPIPGLYAAGATTAGLEGGPVIGYVGGLTKSGVTGLLAAEAIANAPSGGR